MSIHPLVYAFVQLMLSVIRIRECPGEEDNHVASRGHYICRRMPSVL